MGRLLRCLKKATQRSRWYRGRIGRCGRPISVNIPRRAAKRGRNNIRQTRSFALQRYIKVRVCVAVGFDDNSISAGRSYQSYAINSRRGLIKLMNIYPSPGLLS